MTKRTRWTHSAAFKAKVALAAVKGQMQVATARREASDRRAFPGRSQTLNSFQHNAVVVGF